MKANPRLLSLLFGIAALLTFAVIVLGGATRVTDSGMSCPDWPLCYGQFLPFPGPEGGFVAPDRVYPAWQVSLEWTHRLLAALVGLFMIACLVLTTFWRRECPAAFRLLWLPVLLLAVQIGLGGLTVGLSNIHWSVMLHLGVALLFLSSLMILRRVAALGSTPTYPDAGRLFRVTAWATALLVFFTLLMGAMVSSSHAGGVCGGLPDCNGTFLPLDDFGQLIHMKHRFLATLTLIAAIILWRRSKQEDRLLQKKAHGVLGLVVAQIGIGVALLYSFADYPDAYMPLSVFHLAWGTLVWCAAFNLLTHLHIGRWSRHGA